MYIVLFYAHGSPYIVICNFATIYEKEGHPRLRLPPQLTAHV